MPKCAALQCSLVGVTELAGRNPGRFARFADRFGATASFACALHCAALPLLLAILPALGLGFLADHAFERAFIAFASALALASLAFGFRRHRRFRAFGFLVPGVLLLVAGVVVDVDGRPFVHALLVSFGGMLVALSHLANLRLAHAHVHDAACGH
ncbi:MerC mercury resistance protein [Dokdonella fugitiva]|uniref:MerC mercury resistance protein n=2 Tax=Dokdonella fugitiva TaxID=328517 RepID=A0A4R2IBM0_9GAMM|nr:MerC mercury resistance protein [Dokdonella fugitiva]